MVIIDWAAESGDEDCVRFVWGENCFVEALLVGFGIANDGLGSDLSFPAAEDFANGGECSFGFEVANDGQFCRVCGELLLVEILDLLECDGVDFLFAFGERHGVADISGRIFGE